MVNFHFEEESNTLNCIFEGRLDTERSFTISEPVDSQINKKTDGDPGPGFKVVFDIAKVDYIASSFIRICIQSAKKVGKENFSIKNSSPVIKKTFKIAGLDRELNVS
jgi:anti-anti-sigma factor